MRGRGSLTPLVLLTLAGATLRFATLDLQSFWFDEAATVRLVRLDLAGLLQGVTDSESTPPLYYVATWLWSQLLGDGEVGLRSLSAICGTLTIPALYAATIEFTRSSRAALITAGLAAFNPLLVWYSQEARAYAMVLLFGALSLGLFAYALRRPRPSRALVGWAVVSALALATHYFAIFLVAPEALWLLRRSGGRRGALVPVAVVGLVGLALLPLALHQRSLDLASFIREASLAERAIRTPKQLLVGFDAPVEGVLTALAAGLMAVGLGAALRRRAPGAIIAGGLGAAALSAPFLLALVGLDYFDTRNVLVAWLPVLVAAGTGFAVLARGPVLAAALCATGLAAVAGVAIEPSWQREDWRGVARALGPLHGARAIVLTPGDSGELPLRAYRPGAKALPPRGAPVQEVALVSTHARGGGQARSSSPPRPGRPSLRRFVLARRQYADSYTVIVFRAPRPVLVTHVGLMQKRLLPSERGTILLEQGRAMQRVTVRPRPEGGSRP